MNLNFESTPKKPKEEDNLRLSDSIHKTEALESKLKNELRKMSYKAMAECLFEISTQIPSS